MDNTDALIVLADFDRTPRLSRHSPRRDALLAGKVVFIPGVPTTHGDVQYLRSLVATEHLKVRSVVHTHEGVEGVAVWTEEKA